MKSLGYYTFIVFTHNLLWHIRLLYPVFQFTWADSYISLNTEIRAANEKGFHCICIKILGFGLEVEVYNIYKKKQ